MPRLEGIRFETDANPEMHYLLKSLLFRPLYLPDAAAFQSPERPPNSATYKASDLHILQMYEQLCKYPAGPACNAFERGFKAWFMEQAAKAETVVRKRIMTCTWPSL